MKHICVLLTKKYKMISKIRKSSFSWKKAAKYTLCEIESQSPCEFVRIWQDARVPEY